MKIYKKIASFFTTKIQEESNRLDIQIETDSNEIKSKIEDLILDFFCANNIDIVQDKKIVIIISEDFKTDMIKYSSSEMQNFVLENNIQESAGRVILPVDKDFSNFVILLIKDIFNSNQYFSTLTHELVHVIDFINHFKEVGNIYTGNAEYDDFFFWTEFNAKKIGLKRLQQELDKNNEKLNLRASTINFREQNLKEILPDKQVYNLVHFFARISIYDKYKNLAFNEDEFPREYLINLYGEKSIELYYLLNEINNYDEFKINSKLLDEVLDDLIIYN